MLKALRKLAAWFAAVSILALGAGGVVVQAEPVRLPIALQFAPIRSAVASLPTVSTISPVSTPENGDYIQFEVQWSTAGISRTTTVSVRTESLSDAPSAALNSDYEFPTIPVGGSKALAPNSSGRFNIRLPIVDDNILEPDEGVRIAIYNGVEADVLLASTTITIQDDESYSDGLRGNAPLGVASEASLMNAYQLAVISNDIYATDRENERDDFGRLQWQARFQEDYGSPEYNWNRINTYNYESGAAIDTQAVTMRNDSAFVIAFRGTQQMAADALTDALAITKRVPGTSPGVYVHVGFWDALEPVYSAIVNDLKESRGDRTVWITGHSLGGALAQLMAYRIKMSSDPEVRNSVVRVVTFGAPQTGQTAFNNPSNPNSFLTKVGAGNMQRWVNLQDPVPQVPGLTVPGWVHNSSTTLMREDSLGNLQVRAGAPMPRAGATGVSFGDHSLNLYMDRLVELNTRRTNLTVAQFEEFAPTPEATPETPETDIEDPAFVESIKTLGIGVGIGLVAIIGIVIGLSILLLSQLMLSLDFVWNEIAGVIEEAYNATAAEVAELMNTLGASATEIARALRNVFSVTATEIVNLLSGIGFTLAEVATALKSALSMSYEAIVGLFKTLGKAAADVVAAFKTAFSSLNFSSVAAFLDSAGYALKIIAEAIFDAFVVSVNALALALKNLGKAAVDVARALLEGIAATVTQVASALKNVFLATVDLAASILKSIGVVLADIVDVLSSVFFATLSVIATALKSIGALASQIATLLVDVLGAAINAVASALQAAFGAVYDTIASALKTAFEATANAVAAALKYIGGAINDVAAALKAAFNWFSWVGGKYLASALESAFGSVYNAIAGAVKTVLNLAATTVASIIKYIGGTLSEVAYAIKSAFSWAADQATQLAEALESAFGAVYDSIASAIKTVLGLASSAVANVIRVIGATWSEVASAIKYAFTATINAVTSVLNGLGASFDSIASAIKTAFSATASAVASAIKAIGASISQAAAALKSAFGTVYNTIASAIKTAYSASISAITSALKALGAGVSAVASALKAAAFGIVAIANAIWDAFTIGFDAFVDLLEAIGASAAQAFDIVWDFFFG